MKARAISYQIKGSASGDAEPELGSVIQQTYLSRLRH